MSLLGVALSGISGPWRLYAELAVAGVLAIGCAVQTSRLAHQETETAEVRATFSAYQAAAEKSAREAEERVRAIEHDTDTRLQRIIDGADQRTAVAQAAASAASAAADGLRSRVATLVATARRACPGVAAFASAGTPAGDPIGVLADVLGRADARAGILALEADKRRIRALACEDAYELNRGQSSRLNTFPPGPVR